MAQLARPHSHLSNRAKVRSALERKPVFKSVLENPFEINWPSVPPNIQNVILARLVATLENVPPRTHPSRKFPQNTGASDRHGNADSTEDENQRVSGASQFVIGINAVTRALEYQLHTTRRSAVENPSQNGAQLSPIRVVFACSADVDPLALVDHIPYLVAGCNSSRNLMQLIKLVPLPKGSEQTISQVLGVRRAAVVAFRHESPLFETVQDILDSVPIITAPWLCSPDSMGTQQLVPTHIKQLRTTAPKDMKDAREQRSRARAAAKNASSSSQSMRRKPRVTLTTAA